MADMQTLPTPLNSLPPVDTIAMNIGETIRNYRLQKGMSQGDIEKRTGLLRCYLSRQKIAASLDLQLSQFFAEQTVGHDMSALNLDAEEIRFLTQIQRYSSRLSENDRKLLLAMVRKFAQTSLV
jgi:transcriptional regulator with XRE-family HTH domain